MVLLGDSAGDRFERFVDVVGDVVDFGADQVADVFELGVDCACDQVLDEVVDRVCDVFVHGSYLSFGEQGWVTVNHYIDARLNPLHTVVDKLPRPELGNGTEPVASETVLAAVLAKRQLRVDDIRLVLRELGIEQKSLAHRLGISKSHMSMVLSAQVPMVAKLEKKVRRILEAELRRLR